MDAVFPTPTDINGMYFTVGNNPAIISTIVNRSHDRS